MTFKTKILLALIGVNVLAWSSNASAEATPGEVREAVNAIMLADPLAGHAVCAAWASIVSVKLEEPARTLIGNQSALHADFVRNQVERPLADDAFKAVLSDVQLAYNSRQITWRELVMGAEECGRYL